MSVDRQCETWFVGVGHVGAVLQVLVKPLGLHFCTWIYVLQDLGFSVVAILGTGTVKN